MVAFLACALLMGGCSRSGSADVPTGARAASAASPALAASAPSGPPVAVTTVRAQARELPVTLEATGTVTPLRTVDIKPQASSRIVRVLAAEGQTVRAGQPLFVLDARADEANVAKLQAQLARDNAALADARRQLARARELLAMNFVSQAAVDTAQASVDAQAAAVQADQAAVDAGRVALDDARILAPQAGRLGAVNVSVGAAVVAGATVLVNIVQTDPIEIAFGVPQASLPDVLAAQQGGRAQVTATIGVAAAPATTAVGTLSFVDNAVDPSTGTVKVKARFANPDGRLWPGAFAKVSLTLRTVRGSAVVPLASVVQGSRGSFVYTVVDGQAQPRPVQVLATVGADAAVQGVQPGEAVVLDGRQNLRPGAAVAERPAGPAAGRPADRAAAAVAPAASRSAS